MLIHTACPDMSRHCIAISSACAPRADVRIDVRPTVFHEDYAPL